MGWYTTYGWRPYVSAAERRRRAVREVARMKKAGRRVSAVEIVGRRITTTFWGEAWCRNLEAYSDFANRLPRGRTYVRNGSVIHLEIAAGRIRALVSGSDIYKVDIRIEPLQKTRWTHIKGQCAGKIDSLVELLRGSISKGVMEVVTRKGEGLFPSPREISLSCSCPDWATMCKHVAATLYGVGARLDHKPEMLFTLRGVDPAEMVEAAVEQPVRPGKRPGARVLAADELSSVFGVDIDAGDVSSEDIAPPAKRGRRVVPIEKKTAVRSASARKPRPVRSASKKKPAAKHTARKKEAAPKKKKKKKKKTKNERTREETRGTARPAKSLSKETRKKKARK